MSSCVGMFVSLVVISVQVEICGISAGSIGLSYAISLGLYHASTGQLGNVLNYSSELGPLVWHQNMQSPDHVEIQ